MQDYKHKTDEELVLLANGKDGAAAEELMLRYKDAVRRVARKFSFNIVAEADDLVQEGMIGLYAAIGSFDGAGGRKFKNFVYTCIVRRIYDYLRYVNRRLPEGERVELDPESIAVGETPEELLLSGESEAEFRLRLMRSLSDFECKVVSMYLDGMSYAAISEATGKEIKSIDNALSRAKKKLRKTFRA